MAFLPSSVSSASVSWLADPGAASGPRPGPAPSGLESLSVPESSCVPWGPVPDDPSWLRGFAGGSSLLGPSLLGSSPGSSADSDPVWVLPEPVSVCSDLGRSSGAPLFWLPFSWASRASLSRQELPPSPCDVSSLSPRRTEGPRPFSSLLWRPRLPVVLSPRGRLSSSRRPAWLSPGSRLFLVPRPRRRALSCLPWASDEGPAPGRL